MSIAFQIATAHSPDTASSAIDTTGCDFLVVGVYFYSLTFSDSKGNTWTTRISNGAGGLLDCVNPTVGSGHTFTPAGNPDNCFALSGYSGVSSSSPFDQSSSVYGSWGVTYEPGNVTPSEDNELVVAVFGSNSGSSFSITSPFTQRASKQSSGSVYDIMIADDIQIAATARNPTMGDNGGQGFWAIATYKAAAAGGGPFLERRFPRGINRGLMRGAA